MGKILIKQIKYWGEKYHFESPIFEAGLNIIEGENGSGKSTLMNLIYYSIGGNIKEFKKTYSRAHKEIVNDLDNYVELDIQINNESYLFKRYIDDNDITIINKDKEGDVEVRPIYRSKNEKQIFSDWILEKLNIGIVDISTRGQTFKINFSDIFRLIYHDQAPDPTKIFKEHENSSNDFLDSREFRKDIFQLLLGKFYNEYYKSRAELKALERESEILKKTLEEYTQVVEEFNFNLGDMNIVFLEKRKEEEGGKLEKLLDYRNSLKKNRPNSIDSLSQIDNIKNNILKNELRTNKLSEESNTTNMELVKLSYLFDDIKLEIIQIKKIIYTNDELKLFSENTCPYCLRNVQRKKGCCVCGSDINEEDYEKFFYNSSEYLDILKSKQKSLETIGKTIESYQHDIRTTSQEKKEIAVHNNSLKNELRKVVGAIDNNVNIESLNKVDDEIFNAKSKMKDVEHLIKIEKK